MLTSRTPAKKYDNLQEASYSYPEFSSISYNSSDAFASEGSN